jgi:hypothetical protein
MTERLSIISLGLLLGMRQPHESNHERMHDQGEDGMGRVRMQPAPALPSDRRERPNLDG